jgi:hypothetical protein
MACLFAVALLVSAFAGPLTDNLDKLSERARVTDRLGPEWAPHFISRLSDHLHVSFRNLAGGQILLNYYWESGTVDVLSKHE